MVFLRPRDADDCSRVTGTAGSVHCGLDCSPSSCRLEHGATLRSLGLEPVDPIVPLTI